MSGKADRIVIWIVVIIVIIGAALLFLPSSHETPAPTATSTPSAATSTLSTPAQTPAPGPATPKPSATTAAAPQPAPAPVTVPAKIAGYSSLSYLMKQKEPLYCSATASTAYAKRTGTLYIADGKMRAIWGGYRNGVYVRVVVVDDGMYLYTWQEGAATGIKLPAPSSVSGSVIADAGGVDLVTPITFACDDWTVDATLFTPPSSIVFSTRS